MSDFVYLASQSPRRRQLLAQIGVRHELLLAGDDEDAEALEAERAGELPAVYVERVTLAKLAAARARLQRSGKADAPILCADTTVALGRRILGKPADAAHAARMLTDLSGRTHRVLTAVALWTGRRTLAALSISRVQVAAMPDEVEELRVPASADGTSWPDLLVSLGLVKSKGEARRLMTQGGFYVEQESVTDPMSTYRARPATIIRLGKRRWFRVLGEPS